MSYLPLKQRRVNLDECFIQRSTLDAPILSVIIPVYNSEMYVEDCIDSLMSQNMGNIEFIFIDDASSDQSLEIVIKSIKKYPKYQESITVVHHKSNYGVAITRQEGLELCRGKWVVFCDSDDMVSPEAYKKMIEVGEADNYDMVVCGISTFGEIAKSATSIPETGVMDALYMLEGICGIRKKTIHGSLCNKLIKRALISDVIIPDGLSYCEDEMVLFQVLLKSPKIFCLPNPYYQYRIHSLSLIRTKDKRMARQVEILIDFISSMKQRASASEQHAMNVKVTLYLYRLLKSKSLDIKLIKERYGVYRKYLDYNNKLNILEKIHLDEALKGHKLRALVIGNLNQLGYKIIKLIRG